MVAQAAPLPPPPSAEAYLAAAAGEPARSGPPRALLYGLAAAVVLALVALAGVAAFVMTR